MSITLGKYGFHLVGRKTIGGPTGQPAFIVKETKNEPYELVYVQTYDLSSGNPVPVTRTTGPQSGNPLVFAVYMSQSQMGFCRFASYTPGTTFDKGPDYAQTTLINFKLGQFIISQMPTMRVYGPDENPYKELDEEASDIIRERAHLLDKSRMTQIDDFGYAVPPEKCGSVTAELYAYLQHTSAEIRAKFPTMIRADLVCGHSYATNFANVNGQVFKLILQSVAQPFQYMEIFLYMYTVTLTASGVTENHTIPVLMKMHNPADPEDITPMGTYANYIPSYGAYICKLFEYTKQLPAGIPNVDVASPNYTFIGRLYDNLYPSEHLQAFLQYQAQQAQAQQPAQQQMQQSTGMQGGSKKRHRRHSRIRRRRHRSRKLSVDPNCWGKNKPLEQLWKDLSSYLSGVIVYKGSRPYEIVRLQSPTQSLSEFESDPQVVAILSAKPTGSKNVYETILYPKAKDMTVDYIITNYNHFFKRTRGKIMVPY
jgi:hypothetical protein